MTRKVPAPVKMESICRGSSGVFDDEEEEISLFLGTVTCPPPTEETIRQIHEKINFSKMKLMTKHSEKLVSEIEKSHKAIDLLSRMRAKMLSAYDPRKAGFQSDLDRILEVAHLCGCHAGSLVALNPIEKTKAERDAPDAARARQSREKAHKTRRKAGDAIRRAAFDHCVANPNTTQVECAKAIIAKLPDVQLPNAKARIRNAFKQVEGQYRKRLGLDWRQILGGNDL